MFSIQEMRPQRVVARGAGLVLALTTVSAEAATTTSNATWIGEPNTALLLGGGLLFIVGILRLARTNSPSKQQDERSGVDSLKRAA